MSEYIVGIKIQYLKHKIILFYFKKKKRKKILQKGTYLNNKKVTKTDLLKYFVFLLRLKISMIYFLIVFGALNICINEYLLQK